ncbi:MAG: imidazole glycerol phosphate synthase subunit HisH [Chloroflexi bacterium]|nr:imidazole glycerol phosphate synthase subunit HisH [Chloroflexota bacterium]
MAIIDYGAGNLRSVAKAFERLGYPPQVTNSPSDVLKADAVVLPGVGAAGDTMRTLTGLGLDDAVRKTIAADRPFFGVCLGLQLLFESSEEGGAECLGLLQGRVRRFAGNLKVPHMGWNQVSQRQAHPLFTGVPDNSNFYFVHSYYPEPAEATLVIGETSYGVAFCSALARGNLVATQFHPEKSGDLGLKLYDNFVRYLVLAQKPIASA